MGDVSPLAGNIDTHDAQEQVPRARTAPGRCPPQWETRAGEDLAEDMASTHAFACSAELAGPISAPSRPATTRLPKRGRPQIRSRSQITRATYSSRGGSSNSSTFYVPGIKGPTIAERHAAPHIGIGAIGRITEHSK